MIMFESLNMLKMRTVLLVFAYLLLYIPGFPQSGISTNGLLSKEEAARLAKLPMKCMQKPYPNKLSQTLADPSELLSPQVLHPAFYGCFDWHSSVHGHWMLVRLLEQFPDLPNAAEIKQKLSDNLSSENILKEVEYFSKPHEKSYERTYGWAWLLKLSEELKTWNDPLGRKLESNIQPLTDKIVKLYMNFLPKLNYPVRVGDHPNTAFGLAFAWDYAKEAGNDSLRILIEKRSRDFYLKDADCPLTWEPGGTDFFSPCLEEAELMRRILPPTELRVWLKRFLPSLSDPGFRIEVGKVSDRTDGKLVHLDGLNFSRAWCLYGIAESLPEYAHLKDLALNHIMYSLPAITDGGYEGEHWLASFALLALVSVK
jgi:hypothetical protein